MAPRCQAYLWGEEVQPDIVVSESQFRPNTWPGLSRELYTYMETGELFYSKLLMFDGLMLHASAVELDGRAYLFSGPCGMGKSTHTRLWQQVFGDKAQVFNDDKPALRRLEDRWYAYGTPWCGKDGININMRIPLAGICFLRKAEENGIQRLSPQSAIGKIVGQTLHLFAGKRHLEAMLTHVERLVQEVPIFELHNRPETAAVMLSHETMLNAAREIGL